MKSAHLSLIAIALAAASVGTAFSADASTPKTRDQVRAELAEARSNGTLIADGATGQRARDLFPNAYVAAPAMAPAITSGKTRAQVRAEFEEARRNGALIADGQTGATFRELYPQRFSAMSVTSGSVQVGQRSMPMIRN